MMPKEEGEAGIIVTLGGGKIKVYHQDSKELLFSREARSGDWDRIWKALSRYDVISRWNMDKKKLKKEVI